MKRIFYLAKNFRSLSIAMAMTLFGVQAANAYDLIKRTKLIDDRFKTQEMLRPFGHDFLLDVSAAITSDVQDLIDDADKIGKLTGTTQQQVDQANTILTKYYNTEQTIRARVNLGVPIFSFSLFGIRWQPNLRVDAGLIAVINPKKESITFTSLIDNLDQIPASVRTAIKGCSLTGLSDGDDIIAHCVTQGAITQAEADFLKSAYKISKIPYLASIVNSSSDLPVFDNYIKADAKVGLQFDYTKDNHWFGNLGINALARADLHKKLDATLLIAGGGNIDMGEPNTQVVTAVDYRLGYKNANYSTFFAIEEMKLATMSDKPGRSPSYGFNPLIRLHAQADFRLWFLSATPFIGSHARSGYGFGDAYYLGSDWGAHVWGDRLGLVLRTQVDKEHLTLALRLKLWIMQLEVTSQSPLKNEVDGAKVSGLYMANLRFFF